MNTPAHSATRDPESVRGMFGRIAPRYDLLNHLLSLQVDRWWRRAVARKFRHILARPEARVIDLCCGTGDVLLAMAPRRGGAGARFVGADFCRPMLERAAGKLRSAGVAASLAEADALSLPFAAGTFQLVTAAFGFRNLADYQAGLREMHRVLAPGGEIGILECTEPHRFLRPLYHLYFRRLLPRIGGVISGDGSAYYYLARTVAAFPEPEELAEWISAAGFTDVGFRRLTGGVACLHTARRP